MTLPEMDCWGDVDEVEVETSYRAFKVGFLAVFAAATVLGGWAFGSLAGWW